MRTVAANMAANRHRELSNTAVQPMDANRAVHTDTNAARRAATGQTFDTIISMPEQLWLSLPHGLGGRGLSQIFVSPSTARLFSATTIALLISPAIAMDDQVVAVMSHTATDTTLISIASGVEWGTFGAISIVTADLLRSKSRTVLAPLMGISSVLWFMMRNDSAIPPKLSWIVFSIWSVVTLVYFSYQSRRLAHDKLFILLALTFSGICLCVLAIVQKASIHGGLVTAIPPCISFASYFVAAILPTRRQGSAVDIV
ncbi:hypothetical protein BKA63DRAFT_514884 [Paraphoma chrysanthemicola]|nr:hypothetical protein BKA63DRAFT_514884 [Paraphoma chrysanthemicola]